MNVLEAINSRRSYRGKFKPDPVPREHLVRILNAGLNAPSGCNKQTASLIAVDDRQVLDKLLGVIQPPVAQTAPAAICVLTQRINAYRDKCYAVQDYSAAIENMLLAIVELGYQSCWYEGHITDEDNIAGKMAEYLAFRAITTLCVLCLSALQMENRPSLTRSLLNSVHGSMGSVRPNSRHSVIEQNAALHL